MVYVAVFVSRLRTETSVQRKDAAKLPYVQCLLRQRRSRRVPLLWHPFCPTARSEESTKTITKRIYYIMLTLLIITKAIKK